MLCSLCTVSVIQHRPCHAGTFDRACVLTHFTPTTLTVACRQPRSPCLWCTYAHWPEHAGIRAGVLFYDWVTALTSCLVIRSVLISLPCWKQLSLSPRLVWSCGLSLLWFFLSVTYWEHWGPLTWWGCTMVHQVLISPGLLKGGVLNLKNFIKSCCFWGGFHTFVTSVIKASNVIRSHLQTNLHVLTQFKHRNQRKRLISDKKLQWQPAENCKSCKFRGNKTPDEAFWISLDNICSQKCQCSYSLFF